MYIDSQVLTELKEWAISEEKFEMNKESTGAAAWAVFYKTLAEQTFEELVVFDNARILESPVKCSGRASG